MSLLNDASLIVTPNAYKEGKLYSVIPSDGSGDLSVTRATTATRVNSAGLVELVPYNLFSYSEQLNVSPWAGTEVIVIPNFGVAPNGMLSANKVILNSNLTRLQQSFSLTPSTQYTLSFYVKNISITNVSTSITGITTTGTIAYNSQLVTNQWVRIVRTFTTDTVGTVVIQITRNGNIGGEAEFWGAQLVEGTDALPYQKTETRLNIPRLDYSLGSCPSILVEPQRTNLCTYSENMSQDKSISGLTVLNNTSIAPNGLVTADTLTASLANARISTSAATGTTPITFSVYVKAIDANFIQLIHTGDGNCWANFDILNGIVGTYGASTTSSIESVGNGWYRCSAYFNTNISANLRLYIADNNTSSFGGTTAIIGTSILTWGWQAEAGAYPTSYIPTTSASVTRNADVVSMTNASAYIGQTEGTILADAHLTIKNESGSPVTGLITLNNNVSNLNNCILVGIDRPSSGTNNKIYVLVIVSGAVVAEIFTSTITEGRYKIGFAYKQNDFALYVNGSLVGTDTIGNVPTCSQVLIGSRLNGDTYFLGDKVNSATLYKERLSNAELATLTTI